MRGDLSVAAAADALGTSPQTVRTLLRKGELRGEKRAWGSRYVWTVSQEAVDEFIARYGRLDGQRRPRGGAPPPELRAPEPEAPGAVAPPPAPREPEPEAPGTVAPPAQVEPAEPSADIERPDRRPFILRPRGRATVVVILVGIPLLVIYAVARILPNALWFDELGQVDTFRRALAPKIDLHVQVHVAVSLVVGTNLALAMRGTRIIRTAPGVLATLGVALFAGNLFASAADGGWQSYLLWMHRQPFGVVDPISGKDLGFFVFSLPFFLHLSELLLWLVTIVGVLVVLVSRARGMLHFTPLHATFGVQIHLAAIAAVLLLVVAWRLRLEQYLLELGQPSRHDSHSFAGAGYVDTHVRSPGLAVLTALALVLAVLCVALPFLGRTRHARSARVFAATWAACLVVGVAVVGILAPVLVQRYVVDPNPLLSEQPYLSHSIAATRAGLGLDQIRVEPYSPTGFTAADFPPARERLSRVATWDTWVLAARMRQLATEPPYFRPDEPALDVVRTHGEQRLTVVSARELDQEAVGGSGTWINDRLAYTHGLGLVRFSGTDTGRSREPRLLDGGLGVREPRLYFANLLHEEAVAGAADGGLRILTTNAEVDLGTSSWVLANTRRPEVDVPASTGSPQAPYHYDGDGGIAMLNWQRRAVFALALGSKDLLLSDDITPESRLLLHRDVHERLHALAPFIQWDSGAVPLAQGGRVVYVVDGYTASEYFPNAERVDVGGARVNYARASVVATVDAFSGQVELYVTDESEPLIRAWQEIFPSLFRSISEMPAGLRDRLRYPADLFAAQATAYERFHTTRPDVFASEADVWSRPLALSGPLEVAGDVDFDESDEDDLRLTLEPAYAFAPPPGETVGELVLGTYYSPRAGQNLVGSLHGWIDENGRVRLAARNLPRAPLTLGPAQISRLVFATPRVRNLLGLRNLEIRDLDKSSLDSVLLGQPHLLFLPGGVVQIQSLYEGSRGPGAARLLGVTAFLNGRAGLGPDIESAVRQALNEPPSVHVARPAEPLVVGKPVKLAFRVENAQREVVTISSGAGRERTVLHVTAGRGTVTWVPSRSGDARVTVTVRGMDGTVVSDSAALRVLGPAPRLRLIDAPRNGVLGRPLRLVFNVRNAVDELATISTRSGIEFTRRFELKEGRGVITWTPDTTGSAVLVIRARGHQGQVTSKTLRIDIAPSVEVPPPTVTLVQVPETLTVGEAATFAFEAGSCRSVRAQIEGAAAEVRVWRFPCPADPARISWTPTTAGSFLLTVNARGDGTSSEVSVSLDVEEP